MSHRVAAFQFAPDFMDTTRNVARIENALSTLDAAIGVFPELCSTGYWFRSREELLSLAETADGSFVTMLRDQALARKTILVAGFAERDGNAVYNTAVTVLPDGARHVYRKTHLFAEEKTIFAPGDTGFPVVRHEGLSLGVMICYDWRFPEAARTLALRGADVILHPSALVALPRLWKPVMRTRAFENRVATVTANRTGTEWHGEASLTFHGSSQIVDVNGDVLAETGTDEEGWIAAEIDPTRARRKAFSEWNDIFLDRRPDMYDL